MHKRLLTILVLSFALVLFLSGRACACPLLSGGASAAEAQKAWLRLYPGDGIYMGDNPDPWIQEGYIVYISPTAASVSVNITVENIKKDRDVNQIVVPIVTNDTSVIDNIVINSTTIYPDGSWNTGTLNMITDDGEPLGELPSHGVYNDPTAYWTEYRTGKKLTSAGTPGDSLLIGVTINFSASGPGDIKIHFDAYGWVEESGKKPVIIDDNSDAAFAPFSKDLTITVPELFLPLLATTSLGMCCYLLLKRKLTKVRS